MGLVNWEICIDQSGTLLGWVPMACIEWRGQLHMYRSKLLVESGEINRHCGWDYEFSYLNALVQSSREHQHLLWERVDFLSTQIYYMKIIHYMITGTCLLIQNVAQLPHAPAQHSLLSMVQLVWVRQSLSESGTAVVVKKKTLLGRWFWVVSYREDGGGIAHSMHEPCKDQRLAG